MKILIAGDFCDKLRVKDAIRSARYNLLDNLRPYTETADYSIVNFEFPIVKGEAHPIVKNGPSLYGQPQSVNVIKSAGFNVCTLANNHILDQGADCCLDTIELLKENGFETVGVGANLEEAGRILYLRTANDIVAVINCCENEFSIAEIDTPGANPLNPIKQWYKIHEAKEKTKNVIVIMHGGHEGCQLPSPRIKELCHFFVDAGASAVFLHHQHCYSGYEIYNSAPIFYGLGNLLFDHIKERNSIWNEGYIVTLDVQNGIVDNYTVLPYNQCNNDASLILMDDCQKDSFESKISGLNTVIRDDVLLTKEWHNWMDKTTNLVLSYFEPLDGRFARLLSKLHIMPKFIKGRRKIKILNYIRCESHRDRVIYAFLKPFIYERKPI